MRILTRKQFREYWNAQLPGLGNDTSVLWAYERELDKKCHWFVSVKPIQARDEFVQQGQSKDRKQSFWGWCHQHCRGQLVCYSSSDTEEWWGFTHHADVAWWMLRWA